MALLTPVLLREEVHLEIGRVRAAAQEVVADEAVEVVGRGRSGVALDVVHGRVAHGGAGERGRDARGLLERRAVRHVDHHLELALVVERQHLHVHELKRHQRDAAEEQHDDTAEEQPAAARVQQQRPHGAPVDRGQAVFALVVRSPHAAAADVPPPRA